MKPNIINSYTNIDIANSGNDYKNYTPNKTRFDNEISQLSAHQKFGHEQILKKQNTSSRQSSVVKITYSDPPQVSPIDLKLNQAYQTYEIPSKIHRNNFNNVTHLH